VSKRRMTNYCLHIRVKWLEDMFLFGLHFNPENENYTFLRNVGSLLTDYRALYTRRQSSSLPLWEPKILRTEETKLPVHLSIRTNEWRGIRWSHWDKTRRMVMVS
jgi:hypothetical protein